MRIRWINTYDPRQRLRRLARVTWKRGRVGDGQGYSAKLTLALTPRLFRVTREFGGWIVTLLGVRVHHSRSFGGVFDG